MVVLDLPMTVQIGHFVPVKEKVLATLTKPLPYLAVVL